MTLSKQNEENVFVEVNGIYNGKYDSCCGLWERTLCMGGRIVAGRGFDDLWNGDS